MPLAFFNSACSQILAGFAAILGLLSSFSSDATVTSFTYIEPGCPQAGDEVILKDVFKSSFPSLIRRGNTFRITYGTTDVGSLFPINTASASLGSLTAGTYTVEMASTIGGVYESFDFVVGASLVDHSGAWHQTSSAGHGLALFRTTKTIAGTFYSYAVDNKPTWFLLQTAHCTPTGYRGAIWQYLGQPWGVTDRAAQEGLSDKPPPTILGLWKFDAVSSSAATFTYQLPPSLILSTFPGVSQLATTIRPMVKLQFP